MAPGRSKSPAGVCADNLTPAMRQYAEQKAAAPEALLLFRMGDFYETFFEDARTASRVLGIALTSRGRDKGGESIPLAGIPYHALESYLTKLVKAGLKVAISEQVEDPKLAKGVVKREIVRIVTPGTLTDDGLLDQRADNYLACACRRAGEVGLATVELSTGAFWVQATNERELLDELARLSPAEILLAETPIDAHDPLAAAISELAGRGGAAPAVLITRRPAHLFDPYQAQERLCKHFGVVTLEGFGFDRIDASLCAAAVIIDYLAETQKTSLQHIVLLHRRHTDAFVWIDQSTWRSLEIERTIRTGSTAGSLLHAVDRTSSPMGARCLRRWLSAPLRDPAGIRERQDAVAALLADVRLLDETRGKLGQLADIERITARLGVGRASPRDLVGLGRALLTVEKVADRLDQLALSSRDPHESSGSLTPFSRDPHGNSGSLTPFSRDPQGSAVAETVPDFLERRRGKLRGEHELAEFLTAALRPEAPLTVNEGGIIAAGYDAELDRLRSIGADGQQWLADYQAREIERTRIPSLKVGFNQVFGYYLEVTHTHGERVPPDYVRKQTLKNAERYITDELKKYETEVLTARDRANAREAELFEVIRQRAVERIRGLQEVASAVAEIDVIAGLARLADERRYVRPELVDDQLVLEIKEGRHPVLEQTLAEKFVPNDCQLGPGLKTGNEVPQEETGTLIATSPGGGETLMILTGPNMAGKSTYIRQIALMTVLAQTGSYVPASSMRLAPVDRIFARVGASDELTRGQSTFMVEMTEAANILNNASERSLVIIDELGRGTSTFDGLALAWAIAEQLVTKIRCRTLFATHYHELTDLEHYLAGVANCNVAVREWKDEVVFLHRIARGATDKSYGVHVAKLAGIGAEVLTRSRELLAELESNFSSPRRMPRRAARRTKQDNQLLLFADPTDEVIEELRRLDPNAMTPLQALQAIERLKAKLRGE